MKHIKFQSNGKSTLVTLSLLLLTISLVSCASAPPKRTPYSGPDKVGAVDPAALVGTWSGRSLNPIEGEQFESAIYTYGEDGSASADIKTSGDNGFPMELRVVGRWSAEGEFYNLVTDDVEFISEVPALVKILAKAITNSFKKSSGPANPYEVSANRIVMVGSTGQAVELTRL
ncbi:MAG: hypothetical protein KTR32_38185 [Granulosicoccus sp.]|nr:hypothetical protein [Granulosicoccus sp.]